MDESAAQDSVAKAEALDVTDGPGVCVAVEPNASVHVRDAQAVDVVEINGPGIADLRRLAMQADVTIPGGLPEGHGPGDVEILNGVIGYVLSAHVTHGGHPHAHHALGAAILRGDGRGGLAGPFEGAVLALHPHHGIGVSRARTETMKGDVGRELEALPILDLDHGVAAIGAGRDQNVRICIQRGLDRSTRIIGSRGVCPIGPGIGHRHQRRIGDVFGDGAIIND